MIKTGRNNRTDTIIKMILEKIDELNIFVDFDNTYPNHYALIVDGERYEFNTYTDVYNAVKLMVKVNKSFEK